MATEDKRWRLVCYDIRDAKRYRKVYKIVRGHGRRLQFSVFRCRLDDREVEKLRWRPAHAYFDGNRSPIPNESGHRFRTKAVTDSE